jgi:hypothetical protein
VPILLFSSNVLYMLRNVPECSPGGDGSSSDAKSAGVKKDVPYTMPNVPLTLQNVPYTLPFFSFFSLNVP